jgi:hypothetical protein
MSDDVIRRTAETAALYFKGVEKARKEKHFKKREESPFASFLTFLSVFALVF